MPNHRNPLDTFQTIFPRQFSGEAARVLALYNQIRAYERYPAERQTALITEQLRHLILHARRFSPFWRKKLVNVVVRERPMHEFLSEIAPLSRNELQTEFEELSAKFPQREALRIDIARTSGSTGTPVKVERANLLYGALYQAMAMVTSEWHGIDPKKPLGVLMRKVTDNGSAPLGHPFSWFGPVATGFSFTTKDREAEELYEYCVPRMPAYLQCGSNTAAAMARYALAAGRKDVRPEKILTTGAVVSEDIRDVVRDGLGAKIVDRYSCEEAGYIALQCPKHEHFHVISPVTHVEIVDDYGAPCPVGVPGRVLLTSMQSYAMPLIRYEIGDMAEWGPPCDCGLLLPVIKTIWGRTRHFITTPAGRKTYARIYARDFQDIAGLLAYRFVLHRNETVVAQLRVLEPSPALAAMVVERVQRALDYPYPVEIRYVDEIDWGNSWKQDYFGVSDAPP